MERSAPPSAPDLTTGSGAPAIVERPLEQALGHEIRQLRRRHDMTVNELATAAGISSGMLSKIENGQISPSLATLQMLAVALSVPITALFSSFEERRDCSFVKAGQGVPIERRGTKIGHLYELLGHVSSSDVIVEPYLITLKEEAEAYVSFQHAGMELIYMLSGELIYRHGGKSYHMRQGDTLLFDAGALHGPETLIERPCNYLSIIMYQR
ncbi:transcriptional regulator, XRE family with cupin sensor [Arboricoccus pini]|uniref:Transcriptional regulator, XRE family with cupin sensor n=1 Tax=Arboricoccus pini TaxID=1963835 RepID=A0A212RI74_9PROT|nr:transcriptional regulator, XRE family with cupin sensor [Arboricoccus pini]